MKLKRVAVPLVVFAAASFITCSGNPFSPQADAGAAADAGEDPGPEPIYAEGTTDEAWRSMVDAKSRLTESALKGSTFTVPTEGQTLPSVSPATFSWTTPLTAMVTPVRRSKPFAVDLFATAHAHGTPVTGDIYWLHFYIPGQANPVSVLTIDGSWTPDEPTWALLKSAPNQDIRAEIESAYMTENRVTEGPFKAPGSRRFRIN